MDNPDQPVIPPFPLRRSLALAAAVVVIGAAASAGVLAVLDSRGLDALDQLAPAGAGAAVALLAAALALAPMRTAHRGHASTVPMRALAGTGVRMLVSLLGLAALVAGLGMDRLATACWVLGWYLAMLALEATILTRYFQTLPPELNSRAGAGTVAGVARTTTTRVERPTC